MSSSANVLQVYKELAECYERRGQAQMRDRFLVLAADAALSVGQTDEAERLRQRLLHVNPHHMLKPYTTFDQARAAPDVDTYVRNLRLNYPLEVAADLLRALKASDDPDVQALQQTAPTPPSKFREDQTFNLDPDADRTINKTIEDEIEGTLALPQDEPHPSARPAPRKPIDLAETAHLPFPAAPRPRVPTRTEPERTQPPPRPAAARPAPRTAAPSKPAAPSRPPAAKVPPRPAPGPSPFATFPNEEKASFAPRKSVAPDDPEEGSGWLASVLLILVGVLGVGIAAYTIARPFLP